MWFRLFMFICDLIIPFDMIICGRMMWKYPPKSINGIIGYRTIRSMRNMDTWNFAHDYCGRLWRKTGWIMLISSVIIQLPFYKCSDSTIETVSWVLCVAQCVILIISVFLTEAALKKKFH